MKKNIVSLMGILVAMSVTACSNKPEDLKGDTQNVQKEQEDAKYGTENHNQNSAIECYVNVLQNYISAGKTDFTVSFIDLDDDSTREMVVFFGESQADGGYLFTIKNGEAIQVLPEGGDCFGQYGRFTYKEKENIFITENESVTESQISNQIFYYTMENGNGICNDVTQIITQFDSDETKFYVNDTEVESEKFNIITEKYGLLEMSTVNYSGGVRVINEQMDRVYNAYTQNQEENDIQPSENADSDIEKDDTINTDSEMTSEELLDLFINGSIDAIDITDMTSTFHITDFSMNSEEWDAYSIGERVDLDNDGENELILCGPYGGIYLDAHNNKVYKFAAGEGDSLVLSYVIYNGSTWIMYSNRMHQGYEAYHMEKFEGSDNLVAEMNFNEELIDENNVEGERKYTLNGTEISYDEYFELCSKIFAAEVNTY